MKGWVVFYKHRYSTLLNGASSYSSMPVSTVCKTHCLERGWRRGTHVSAQANTCTLDKICEQTVKKVHDMFLVGVESIHI